MHDFWYSLYWEQYFAKITKIFKRSVTHSWTLVSLKKFILELFFHFCLQWKTIISNLSSNRTVSLSMRATVARVPRLSEHDGDRKRLCRSGFATITIIPLFNPIECSTRSSVLLLLWFCPFLVSRVYLGQSSRENGTAHCYLSALSIIVKRSQERGKPSRELLRRSNVSRRCRLQLADTDKFDLEIIVRLL